MVNAGKGSLKISFPATLANNYTLLYFTVGAVSNTKKYSLRFSTLGTGSNGNLRASLRQTAAPLALLTTRQTATYGTVRVDHEFIFTAPTTEAAASFLIELGQNSGTTYIDNIAFFELGSSNNLVGDSRYENGSFETGISSLFTYSSNSNHVAAWDTSSKITAIHYFTVTDAANASSTAFVKTSQPVSPLQASITAGLITAANPTTTVTVSASGGTGPYTGTGVYTNMGAGTHNFVVIDAKGCLVAKSITLTQTNGRVAYADAGNRFVERALSVNVSPNPSVNVFDLALQGGTSETTSILVSTADGKIVYTFTGKPQSHYLLGENFSAGLYFVQVRQGSVVKTLRAVKIR